MSTQKQIKKILTEEFSEEVNEIFGFGKKKPAADGFASLAPQETSKVGFSLTRVLPKDVRKEVFSKIVAGISEENLEDVLNHLQNYYNQSKDEEIKGFISALSSSLNEEIAGVRKKLMKAYKQGKFSDLSLILVPQILKKSGVDIGLSSAHLNQLRAFDEPGDEDEVEPEAGKAPAPAPAGKAPAPDIKSKHIEWANTSPKAKKIIDKIFGEIRNNLINVGGFDPAELDQLLTKEVEEEIKLVSGWYARQHKAVLDKMADKLTDDLENRAQSLTPDEVASDLAQGTGYEVVREFTEKLTKQVIYEILNKK